MTIESRAIVAAIGHTAWDNAPEYRDMVINMKMMIAISSMILLGLSAEQKPVVKVAFKCLGDSSQDAGA